MNNKKYQVPKADFVFLRSLDIIQLSIETFGSVEEDRVSIEDLLI